MESFNGLRDMRRAFDHLAKRDFAENASPTEQLLFFLMSTEFQSAYLLKRSLIAGEIASGDVEWRWWENPADAFLRNVRTPKFWHPPDFKFPGIPSDPWLFHPALITIESYNVAGARTVMGMAGIRCSSVFDINASVADVDERTTLLGVRGTNGTKERQVFMHNAGGNNGVGPAHINPLFDYGILHGDSLTLTELSDVIATDFLVWRMIGKWKFNPRLLQSGERVQG